jgi:hypothetical protein
MSLITENRSWGLNVCSANNRKVARGKKRRMIIIIDGAKGICNRLAPNSIRLMRNPAIFFATCLFISVFSAKAQDSQYPYRASAAKINDLVHMKLDLHFDYQKMRCLWQSLAQPAPAFYPTDTLRLDAKGMDLKNIAIVKTGQISL